MKSNCCGASVYENTDICIECKEHCEVVNFCTNCGEEISKDREQCSDCDPEWLQDK